MPLETQEVIDIIDKGVSDKVKLARKWAKKNNMHITGKNVKQFLERLDTYETNAQKILREKLVKSNRSLFSFITRPTDKIFTAKGGSINYNVPKNQIDTLKRGISDVADGLDIQKFLKKVVKKHYLIDPNSVVFIDIDKRGKLETHIITSDHIFWYENKGNRVDAIIFEPYRNEEDDKDDKLYYRVIDEAYDRIFVQDNKDVYELVSERLDNYFKFVPAMLLGDEKCPNHDIFESLIADIIEDADKVLRDVSTMNVHDLAHLYPKYWSYAQACTRCQGEGVLRYEKDGENKEDTCSSCGGSGIKSRTNPSDEMVLPIPMDGEKPLAPDVAGFVSPDINTARFYREILEKSKNAMFQAMWGTTYEQGGKRETATGRFLDAQPVQDRLRDISDTFASIHKFMLDCYGRVLLQVPSYESSVSYGKRYILEGPDDILDKYVEVSRENVSELGILDLRDRYFEAEYQDDKVELQKRKKLARVEPFPTMKVADVMKIEGLPEQEKLKKLYYSEWTYSLTDAEVMFSDIDRLKLSLTEYVASKSLTQTQLENGQTS